MQIDNRFFATLQSMSHILLWVRIKYENQFNTSIAE